MLFISDTEWSIVKMVMYGDKVSSIERHKIFPIDTLRLFEGKGMEWVFWKLILTYCTKCNEINISHSDIQKHVSYEKCFK